MTPDAVRLLERINAKLICVESEDMIDVLAFMGTPEAAKKRARNYPEAKVGYLSPENAAKANLSPSESWVVYLVVPKATGRFPPGKHKATKTSIPAKFSTAQER